MGIDLSSVDTYDRTKPPQPINPDQIYPDTNFIMNFPAPPDPAAKPFARITSEIWRKFSFKRVEVERARLLQQSEQSHRMNTVFGQLPGELVGTPQQDIPALERPRRRGLSLTYEHYEEVARVVNEAKANGDRNTLKALQARFGITRDMANYQRKRAQQLDLLPPPVPRTKTSPK